MAPKLSIVVGSHNTRDSLVECLKILEGQQSCHEVEIIVVDNSSDGSSELVAKVFPAVKLLRAPETYFVPELWGLGINHTSGEIVAITIGNCLPSPDWIDTILKAHESPYAGIGGAIENEGSGGLVEWAIYFCRYARYMPPFPEKTVADFAGDNASYKRSALDGCQDLILNGFWEPTIHAAMRKQGGQLFVTPKVVVYHRRAYSFAGFMKQRFSHGGEFGSARALNFSGVQRVIYALLSPLIPAVFILRITREVLTKKRHLEKYLLSLPILFLFLSSWAMGELTGYLGVAGKNNNDSS